jgi:hypothetical protein
MHGSLEKLRDQKTDMHKVALVQISYIRKISFGVIKFKLKSLKKPGYTAILLHMDFYHLEIKFFDKLNINIHGRRNI